MSAPLLVVGEIFVDFTVTPTGIENKLRLGGVTHAARGLWSTGTPYAVAAVCPEYLRDSAESYLDAFGCAEFIHLGQVLGAPNVMVIGDPIEVGDQGYEELLREEKAILLNAVASQLSAYQDILIFPGSYDLHKMHQMLPNTARTHLDIAYDVRFVEDLLDICEMIETILISTSSALFVELGRKGINELSEALNPLSPNTIVLKENRGGSRVYRCADKTIEHVPALLGTTVNSVGVGDVFSACYVNFLGEGSRSASHKAARISSAYAQTLYPDVFKKYVERALKLTVDEMCEMGGTSLPWEERKKQQIYLAAPDFSYGDRRAVDEAIRSLSYHNFRVRRPVQENGELPKDAGIADLQVTYRKDVDLLCECSLVFAVPTGRDPGTLVEIGLAIQMGIPVVVFDPANECRNTMVIAGSTCYAQSLDECLNAVFDTLSINLAEKNE